MVNRKNLDLIKKQGPRFTFKIGIHYILWFEAFNQYIVVSESLKVLLDVFSNSSDEAHFIQQLNAFPGTSLEISKIYYTELSEFYEAANAAPTKNSTEHIAVALPDFTEITTHYNFGGTIIIARYGSLAIKHLIHPQWAHAVTHTSTPPSVVFDFFMADGSLYLYKNENYLAHYPKAEFHLLQGQFALQLINVLYQKDEADWIATFHASTICNDQEAIMLIGDSGNGKSTLATVLMANGLDVLADDFTPLSAMNSEIFRFPSGISVKKGAYKMLQQLYPHFTTLEEHSSTSKSTTLKYIPPKKAFGAATSHLPCRKIVYVKYEADVTSKLNPIATDKILPALITESWLSPLASNAKRFLDWLTKVECFELHYSDNEFAVAKIKGLFSS